MLYSKSNQKDFIKVSTLYKVLCIMCISMHVFLTLFFAYTKILPLTVLNSISVVIYLSAYLLIRNKQYAFVTLICCIEIILNVFISSMFLGWNSGFYFYLFGFVPLCFYCKFKSNVTKFAVSALIVAFFLGTYFSSNSTIKLFDLVRKDATILYLTNAFCCFCALSFLSYIYTKTIIYETYMLNELNKQLEVLANTDPLTGLLNRRSMMTTLSNMSLSFIAQKINYSLILIDIDDFKVLNDKYGHECGDMMLKEVCNIIKSTIRSTDIICRWGGEEILILLPKTEIHDAKEVANKLRLKIQDFTLIYEKQPVRTTITAGVSCMTEGKSVSDLINQADACMYKGKSSGKNCVVAINEIA